MSIQRSYSCLGKLRSGNSVREEEKRFEPFDTKARGGRFRTSPLRSATAFTGRERALKDSPHFHLSITAGTSNFSRGGPEFLSFGNRQSLELPTMGAGKERYIVYMCPS
jgi:hypothetical protein